MPPDAQERLVGNIVDEQGRQCSRPEIQLRQLCHFFRADPSYGMGVASGLGINLAELPGMDRTLVHV